MAGFDRYKQWVCKHTGVFVLAILLTGCAPGEISTPYPTPECPPCPQVSEKECPDLECMPCPQVGTQEVAADIPLPDYQSLLEGSAHHDRVDCDGCHRGMEAPQPPVLLASGVELADLGLQAKCIACHQGADWTAAVNEMLEDLDIKDFDSVDKDLQFVEMGQSAPAVVSLGAWGKSGYQYPDKSYDARFSHVTGQNRCTACHNPHSLVLNLGACSKCHQGVDAPDDFDRIRGEFSGCDYDGDKDTGEGIREEIAGLQEILYQAIRSCAEQGGGAIAYDPATSPYYFVDLDENGEVSVSEASADNRYTDWSARLFQAAYNYHFSRQDRGAFIHNGKYVIQLLFDSIEDLDPSLVEDLSRDDAGHFSGAAGAWRAFDSSGEVEGECARCHSAEGLPVYLTSGDNFYAQDLSDGLACETCHSESRRHKRFVVEAVFFPAGGRFSIDPDSNLCLNCHQGRANSTDLEKLLQGLSQDEVNERLSIPDIHGYPAALTLFGDLAGGAFQYPGKRYAGRNYHVKEFDGCVDCHGGHALEIDEEQCATCHGHRASDERTKPQHHPSAMGCRDCHGMVEVGEIRGHKDYLPLVDYDGDGNRREGLSQEVATMQAALYRAIQTYAGAQIGSPLVFDPRHYPYYFVDLDGDGQPGREEAISENAYRSWTPRLLRAAYNYLLSVKDPGAYAHNGKYILQALYDSLSDLGGDTKGMIRP